VTAATFAHQLHSLVYRPRPVPTHQDLCILCISRGWVGPVGTRFGNGSGGQSGCALRVPRHQTMRSWKFPAITRLLCHSSGFLAHFPPINTFWEDARLWEILPRLSPFRMAAWGSRCFYFVDMFYLSYIITILLARSKSVRINICENKY
jgi:hypothetical protein